MEPHSDQEEDHTKETDQEYYYSSEEDVGKCFVKGNVVDKQHFSSNEEKILDKEVFSVKAKVGRVTRAGKECSDEILVVKDCTINTSKTKEGHKEVDI